MSKKLLFYVIPLTVIYLAARLPIFPLVTEVREFSQQGESLYQTWEFVSLPGFYDAARFARSGWLDTTWRNYLLLFLVNHTGLAALFFSVKKLTQGVFR